jgi:hypothetical protein
MGCRLSVSADISCGVWHHSELLGYIRPLRLVEDQVECEIFSLDLNKYRRDTLSAASFEWADCEEITDPTETGMLELLRSRDQWCDFLEDADWEPATIVAPLGEKRAGVVVRSLTSGRQYRITSMVGFMRDVAPKGSRARWPYTPCELPKDDELYSCGTQTWRVKSVAYHDQRWRVVLVPPRRVTLTCKDRTVTSYHITLQLLVDKFVKVSTTYEPSLVKGATCRHRTADGSWRNATIVEVRAADEGACMGTFVVAYVDKSVSQPLPWDTTAVTT